VGALYDLVNECIQRWKRCQGSSDRGKEVQFSNVYFTSPYSRSLRLDNTKIDNLFTISDNKPLSTKSDAQKFFNSSNFGNIKIPSLEKYCIVKRSVFQRGIRKGDKFEKLYKFGGD